MPTEAHRTFSGLRDPDLESRLRARIKDAKFKRLLSLRPFCFKTISSTQKFLAEELATSTEGDFALALVQTEGRGREGRKWTSDFGGLWLSIVLEPDTQSALGQIVLISSLAIKDTLELDYLLANCTIKPPNDVYCNGKKIAGVLADAMVQGERSLVCLGLGANLNNDPSSNEEIAQIATSYRNETGNQIEIEEFLIKLLIRLDLKYHHLLIGGGGEEKEPDHFSETT